jgi:hypothetical protein
LPRHWQRELAQRIHALSLTENSFGLLALGYVAQDDREQRFATDAAYNRRIRHIRYAHTNSGGLQALTDPP